MSGATLLETFLARAREAPGLPMLADEAGILDRGTVARRVAAASRSLSARGVRPGDRVLLSAANAPEVAIAYLAIHATGAIATILAPETPPAERADIIARTRPALALGVGEDALALDALSSDQRANHDLSASLPAPSAAADLLFTTGTTGQRKGVLLRHDAVLAIGRAIAAVYGTGPGDLQALPLPLSHSYGLGCLRCAVVAGHALLIERGMVNPRALLGRMEAAGANSIALVPAGVAMIERFARRAFEGFGPRLRLIEIGSAPIAPDLRAWLAGACPDTRILHHYGMTEASRAVFADWRCHPPGTAGRAAPSAWLTICDPDGAPLAPGVEGEIHVAGSLLMAGYWTGPETPPDRSRIGPFGFRSGDFGRLAADGTLTLLGRADDIINVGGKKVVPELVEDALMAAHPAVREAACIGRPDPVLGEAVEAHLVLDGSVAFDAIAAALEGRVEPHAVPRFWVVAQTLPRTPSGKLRRGLLRAARG